MRTVVAPLAPEVKTQLGELDDQLGVVVEGYLARLRLEPYLGHVLVRGLLGWVRARAVYVDRDDRPDQIAGDQRGRLRLATADPSKGPRWRVVYRVREAPHAGIRVVQVLAIGVGHAEPGDEDAYRAAARLLDGLLNDEKRRKR